MVREVPFAFRQRTSCAEDHLVIEILQGTGRGHQGNSSKVLPVQIAESLDRGRGHDVVKAARHTGLEKEWFADDAWPSSDCSASNDGPPPLQRSAAVGGNSTASTSRSSAGLREAHEVVCILKRAGVCHGF